MSHITRTWMGQFYYQPFDDISRDTGTCGGDDCDCKDCMLRSFCTSPNKDNINPKPEDK